jgi:hypothetical protein
LYILRPELGTKRLCVGCAARFYDLMRLPPTCPKCGVVQPPEVPRPRYTGRGSMPGGMRRAPWQATPAPAHDDAEPVVAAAEDEDDEADVVVADDDDDADADVAEIDAEIPLRPGTAE